MQTNHPALLLGTPHWWQATPRLQFETTHIRATQSMNLSNHKAGSRCLSSEFRWGDHWKCSLRLIYCPIYFLHFLFLFALCVPFNTVHTSQSNGYFIYSFIYCYLFIWKKNWPGRWLYFSKESACGFKGIVVSFRGSNPVVFFYASYLNGS